MSRQCDVFLQVGCGSSSGRKAKFDIGPQASLKGVRGKGHLSSALLESANRQAEGGQGGDEGQPSPQARAQQKIRGVSDQGERNHRDVEGDDVAVRSAHAIFSAPEPAGELLQASKHLTKVPLGFRHLVFGHPGNRGMELFRRGMGLLPAQLMA